MPYGRLHLAAESAEKSIEWIESSETTPPPIVGGGYGALGWVYYEWNQVEKAREYFHRGIQLSTLSGHNASLIYTRINLARLYQSEGDFHSASKTLAEALELLQSGDPDWPQPVWIARQVNLYFAENKLVEAEAVLRQSDVRVSDEAAYSTDEIHMVYLRILLHRKGDKDLEQGIALAVRILSLAESGKRNSTVIQVLTLGMLPRMTPFATSLMNKKMKDLGVPPVREYLEMMVDGGAHLFACKMSVDMMGLTKEDFIPGVENIVTASDFMDMTEGAQIIFI